MFGRVQKKQIPPLRCASVRDDTFYMRNFGLGTPAITPRMP
jgi:hypothetical protein